MVVWESRYTPSGKEIHALHGYCLDDKDAKSFRERFFPINHKTVEMFKNREPWETIDHVIARYYEAMGNPARRKKTKGGK